MNMKKMKKKLALAMAAVMCITSLGLTACGGREQGEELDSDKSILNVGIFNAGVGKAWLEESAADFEAAYADVSFEDGKKGVQVVIDAKKDEFKPGNLKSTMPSYDNAIYFLNQSDFEGFMADGLMADMTTVVNEKVYDAEGNIAAFTGKEATQSIMDTMYPEYRTIFDVENKTYAIPYTLIIMSMMYDADLFDSEHLYISAQGKFNKSYEDVLNGDCGPGPDGKMGTEDDGMPQTWPQFVELMDTMKRKGITPFTWSGQTPYQRWYGYTSIWANYEGYDDYFLNYTLEGTHSTLGPVTEETSTAVLSNQEGRKAAIKAFNDIVKGEYYSKNAFTQGYTEAQTEYVMSKTTSSQIAFFMEGSYWENEARDTFDRMAISNAEDGYGKRNFKILPIPNFVGVEGIKDQKNVEGNEVLVAEGGVGDMVMISEKNTCDNPKLQKELAGLFLQFVNSREQLVKFIKNTGACIRPFNVTASEEEVATLTKFGQSLYNFVAEGSKIVSSLPISAKRKQNISGYETYWRFSCEYTGRSFTEPASLFKNYPAATVDDVFAALKLHLERVD